MSAHRHGLRVRYGECDPQGIVFNANYLLYFDVSFTELWRDAVGPWQEMVQHGVDAVVAHADVDFHQPARFDDVLTLRAEIVKLGRTAITTEIDVLRGEELLVKGHLRHVCVSTETLAGNSAPAKVPIPAYIREGLRRFAAPDAES
ncbi:MAG TPA: thioesterase family protein [Solirubrobacteraceae bacterium]